MSFQIQKDVPLPTPANSKHHELKAVCDSMEVGDSLLLDDKVAHTAASFIRKIFDVGHDRSQRKATTRREGGMRRVWRIA